MQILQNTKEVTVLQWGKKTGHELLSRNPKNWYFLFYKLLFWPQQEVSQFCALHHSLPSAACHGAPAPRWAQRGKGRLPQRHSIQNCEDNLPGFLHPRAGFFFNFLFCVVMYLINNVIVSGEQWRDSAIHIHVSILPQISLLSRLPQHIKQSSLCSIQ